MECASVMVQLLNPFIPHITEELWEKMGNTTPLYKTPWPEFDEFKLVSGSYTMAIQVNGKLRATHDFTDDLGEEDIKRSAVELPSITKHLNGAGIRKIIVVPKKIVNIVI